MVFLVRAHNTQIRKLYYDKYDVHEIGWMYRKWTAKEDIDELCERGYEHKEVNTDNDGWQR